MRNLVQQLIEFGEVRRGVLGVRGNDLNSDIADALDISVSEGAFVAEVVPDSAADKAGIQSGDVIVAVNGDDIASFQELGALISTLGSGTEVDLELIREGERQDVKVTLDAQDTETSAQSIHPALEGATLEADGSQDGIRITEVEPGSPAARIGLEKDDVIKGANRQPIGTLGDLREAIDNAGDVVALSIQRGNSVRYLMLRNPAS